MRWNWQQPDWPNFKWNSSRMIAAEAAFLRGSGILIGTLTHLADAEREQLTIDEMSVEAVTTSEIEGESLNRANVQFAIRAEFGLKTPFRRASAAEHGIAELMFYLYGSIIDPLSAAMLRDWHRMVTNGRRDLNTIGGFRKGTEPMQVLSGPDHAPKVHFEAPPSVTVPAEMERFLDWFQRTGPGGPEPLPPLTRAGIAHLYFECIHPFEDGNGPIGRAIAEKALIQSFGRTIVLALASSILAHRGGYYDALEQANKENEVTQWLAWFAAIALEAQHRSIAQVEFAIERTRFLDRLTERVNPRQKKVLLRMLAEGPAGFKGGLSAGTYCTIAETSPATATRDLTGLVEAGALRRTGERRHARYALSLPIRSVPHISIAENGVVQRG